MLGKVVHITWYLNVLYQSLQVNKMPIIISCQKCEVEGMDYSNYTREQLIELIDELKMLNNELLNEKIHANKLEFAWSGNLGHWYLNLKTGSVVFNPLKIQALGYSMEELPERVKYTFFTDKLHPEDRQRTMDAMRRHMEGKTDVYECEYRIQAKDGSYKWFHDRGKITQRDVNGKPEFVAGIVFNINEKKEQELILVQKNELLKLQSTTDTLTGIRNRRSIMEELDMRINQALTYHYPLAIVLFDIDYFKRINDNNGHLYGDIVLKKVADTLSESIRELDSVGRYGGEEFLVVLPSTEKSNSITIAERIREAVEDLNFCDKVHVTISGGIAVLNGESLMELINKADKKLYEAKNDGRNRIKV